MNEKKIIVITGCTKGLGRALTEQFIFKGHTVLGCGRNKTDLAKLKKEFPSPNHFECIDVTSDKQVANWAQRLLKKFGTPHFIINNAGIINKNAPLWKISEKEFSNVVDINIKGVVNVIRHFLPSMVKKKKGIVVNLSSGWGKFTAPEVAPYCATKFAIEGLTQALAQELPDGMAAIPLSPGIINTQMLRSCFGKEAGNYETPEQWAQHAADYILKLGPQHNGQSLALSE